MAELDFEKEKNEIEEIQRRQELEEMNEEYDYDVEVKRAAEKVTQRKAAHQKAGERKKEQGKAMEVEADDEAREDEL